MADTDGNGIFLDLCRHRFHPAADGLQQQFSGFVGVKVIGDGFFHLFIDIRKTADLSVAPPVETGEGGVFQDRLHQRVDGRTIQVVDMMMNDVFHQSGLGQLLQLLIKQTQFFIDASAPGQTAGYGEFRLGSGDHHRIGEDLLAPGLDGRQTGHAAGEEQQFRGFAFDAVPDVFQALEKDFPEGTVHQTVHFLVQKFLGDLFVHRERQTDGHPVIDHHRFTASIFFPVILIGEILFLQPPCGKFAITVPGLADGEDLTDPFGVGGAGDGFIQKDLIHDAAAEKDLAGSLKPHFLAALDVGKVRSGGSDIHDEDRF